MDPTPTPKRRYPEDTLFYRRHVINLFIPFLVAIAMLIGAGIGWYIVSVTITNNIFFGFAILFLGLAIFVILSYAIMEWMFWYFDFWAITKGKLEDSQLISFFRYSRSELPLRQVQDISYKTSGFFATIFRLGDITVQTASKKGFFQLMSIKNPKKAVQDISRAVKNATDDLYKSYDSIDVKPPVKLGEILVGRNVITREQLLAALTEQHTTRLPLGKILINHGWISKDDLRAALSAQYGVPEIDLEYAQIDEALLSCLTVPVVRKYKVLPISRNQNGVVRIATAYLSSDLTNEVKDACGSPVVFVIADEDQLTALIEKYYPLSS
ncbi:MAG: PH domain-containing protein [Patescibacteria group bacterium]|nr:PH domain-containing protein [Patescibacteria group bacterium]